MATAARPTLSLFWIARASTSNCQCQKLIFIGALGQCFRCVGVYRPSSRPFRPYLAMSHPTVTTCHRRSSRHTGAKQPVFAGGMYRGRRRTSMLGSKMADKEGKGWRE